LVKMIMIKETEEIGEDLIKQKKKEQWKMELKEKKRKRKRRT